MIKKYAIVALALLMFSSYALAKEKKSSKKFFGMEWQKVYGGKDDDIAKGIVMLEDGHTAIIGTCKSFGAKRSDICVTRLNAKGQTVWKKLLGGKKNDRGVAISRAKDGNLLILGEGKSFNKNKDQDIYVAKLSLDGKLLWQKAYGGDQDEFAAGIAGTNDGGVLLVGDTESYSKKRYRDIYIVRLDKNGKMLTTKTIGGKYNDEANALTRTADGNFMMAGSREIKHTGDADFFLLKLNQNGEKIWAKTLGEDQNDVLHAIAPTPDGGIVATGKTRSYHSLQTDLAVMKFNKNGKLIWFKIYGFKYYDEGNAITMSKNGTFIVAGKTNSLGKGNFDNYVLELNNKGKLLRSGIYGGKNRDIAHGITRTTDGAIITVGQSDSFSRNTKFYMIKLK
jgi:uncharacterized delta-60 repeat protein